MGDVLARLQELQTTLTTILLDPRSNLKAAFLLYGIIALVIIIVLVVVIMLIMRSPEEDRVSEPETRVRDREFEKLAVGETFQGLEHDERREGVASQGARPSPRAKVKLRPMSSRARLTVAGGIILLLGAAWVVTGYTTSNPAVCTDCHGAGSEHAKAAAGTDPHANVSCISCHESGGTLGRLVTGVPARLLHFASSQSRVPQQNDYGRVSVAACSSCHQEALAGVAMNVTRGLKISHKEPLAASATCIDCHKLGAGVVGAHNAGMTPCLRCHDANQASAKCVTCHDEKAAAAARARTASFADVQIPELSCGGCHNQKKECDSCHGGVRLPHSLEFRMYAHARAGAVDFWYNGGKTCRRCHTASTRPCQTCHGALLGRGHGTGETSMALGHQTATSASCDTCHGAMKHSAQRDFCKDVCHTAAAIANSPR